MTMTIPTTAIDPRGSGLAEVATAPTDVPTMLVDRGPGWSLARPFDDTGWAAALGCRPILARPAA